MVRAEKAEEIAEKAEQNVEERILDLLIPASKQIATTNIDQIEETDAAAQETYQRTREKLRKQLRDGRLDARIVELEVREKNFPSFEIYTNQGIEEMELTSRIRCPDCLAAAQSSGNARG
jgi:ATP-dependent HslUV protease ATP-binding subunit HslU